MSTWAEETFKYIVRQGYSKIYTYDQHPFDIYQVDAFQSRPETLTFMDEKHSINLYEYCTKTNAYYAYAEKRYTLNNNYNYNTYINIAIYDTESKTLLLSECDNCRLMNRFIFKMYNNLKALVFKKLHEYFYMTDIDYADF